MKSILWFITNGIAPVSVHKSESDAEEELQIYEDDTDFDFFKIYSLRISDLEDYPDEYDLAEEYGFV